MEKHGYEVVISFPHNTWRSVVMLTSTEAQQLIDRLVAIEVEGKLRKDAWYVYQATSVYSLEDINQFLQDNLSN